MLLSMGAKLYAIPKFMTMDMGSLGIMRCPMLPFGPRARESIVQVLSLPTYQVTSPVSPGVYSKAYSWYWVLLYQSLLRLVRPDKACCSGPPR